MTPSLTVPVISNLASIPKSSSKVVVFVTVTVPIVLLFLSLIVNVLFSAVTPTIEPIAVVPSANPEPVYVTFEVE